MENRIIELCKSQGADIVGFAPISRFPEDSAVRKLMPEAKTVIGLLFRVLRGAYRGVEEGSTYYQYTTMGVHNMDEVVMPMAASRLSMMLEEEGYLALPQRVHHHIMAQENETNPEVIHDSIYRGVTQETQLDFLETAVLCGLGEKSLHGALLTDEFGPFVRYCFVITDLELKPTEVVKPHLCDGCGECIKACHGHAIDKDGKVDSWQCATYYAGANGTKNPFMPYNAFADFENRLEIIAGEAKVTPDTARKILDRIIFYPPDHLFKPSICGRACDVACYCHLEKKGVLTKKFETPFRKREEWKFDISDFEVKGN